MKALSLESSLADQGLNPEQINAMDYFLNELFRWNRVHNLTAIEDTDAAINLHLIDSIIIFPILMRYLDHSSSLEAAPRRIADMGSGAAFPGFRWQFCGPSGTFIWSKQVKRKQLFYSMYGARFI